MADEKEAPGIAIADTPDNDLELFIRGHGDEGKTIALQRRTPDGTPEYLGALPFQGFSEEVVRQYYGGGRYIARGYARATPKNPSGYLGQIQFQVAGPSKFPDEKKADTSAGTSDELQRERDARQKAEERNRELEGRRMEDRFVAMQDAMLAMMGEMKELVHELRTPPPQAATADPFKMALDIVSQVEARLAPKAQAVAAAAPALDPTAIFTAFTSILETGMRVGAMGASEEPEGMLGVAKQFLPIFNRLIPEKGLPAAGAPAEPGTVVVPGDAMTLRDELQQWVPVLVDWASRGRHPDVKADFVVDELSEARRVELADLLTTQPEASATLVGWYPELGPHQPWLTRFVQALREDLTPPDDAEEEGEHQLQPGEIEG